MGSGAEEYKPISYTASMGQIDRSLFSPTSLYGGEQLWKMLSDKMTQGLPQDIKNTIIRQALGGLAGNTEVAKRDIETATAGSGLSQSAKLSSLSNLYKSNADTLSNLYANLGLQDYQAKEQNFRTGLAGMQHLQNLGLQHGNLLNQLALGINQLTNQNYLTKYKIDKENEFDWGKVLGGLIQAGGQVGASAIAK